MKPDRLELVVRHPTATERVFVNAEGVKRAYKFMPSASRVLEEQALDRQFNAAAFMPTTKEDKDANSLSEAERRTQTFREPRASAGGLRVDEDHTRNQ